MVYLTSLPHNHLHSFILSWSRVNFIHLTSIFLLCAHSKYPQMASTLTHSPKLLYVSKWDPKTSQFKFPKCLLIVLLHWVLKVSSMPSHCPSALASSILATQVPSPCPLVLDPIYNILGYIQALRSHTSLNKKFIIGSLGNL